MTNKQILLADAERYIEDVFGCDYEQALIELVQVHRLHRRLEESKGELK